MSIMQVLGCILNNPTLISETEKYQLTKDDFPEKFHKIIFATIYNLYHSGTESIDEIAIDGFLRDYDVQYKIFNDNEGLDYLNAITEMANESNFNYYYQRLKKFSLIRRLDELGFDIQEIYDDSLINPKESEEMQEKFDEYTIEEILTVYELKMADLKDNFKTNSEAKGIQAGERVDELLDRLEQHPEIGVPLNSDILTYIFRGSRKKKFYIRSSITGGGKTRNMIADALKISATHLFDLDSEEWVENDFQERSVVISTEMIFDEMQTPALAYISGIEENKILRNLLNEEEKERVRHAANVLKNSPIWFEHLPDFNVKDIERTIEKNIIRNGVEYVYFDYIHSSVTVFSEISKKSGVSLREDQILLLMSDKLKAICNKHDVYLMSATQLNGEWKNADSIDGNLIRGSKAIIDKTDCAMIMLPITKKEKDEIKDILSTGFYPEPNMVTHVFKNRGNEYDKVKVFSNINLGNMRVKDCFMTTFDHKLLKTEKLIINKSKKLDF